MLKAVTKRRRAEEDVLEQALYIARDNPDAAVRYLEAVDAALRSLGRTPKLGGLYKSRNPTLKSLRRLIVPGFKSYLIFYLDLPSTIDVIRVLHGARDLQVILGRRKDRDNE